MSYRIGLRIGDIVRQSTQYGAQNTSAVNEGDTHVSGLNQVGRIYELTSRIREPLGGNVRAADRAALKEAARLAGCDVSDLCGRNAHANMVKARANGWHEGIGHEILARGRNGGNDGAHQGGDAQAGS